MFNKYKVSLLVLGGLALLQVACDPAPPVVEQAQITVQAPGLEANRISVTILAEFPCDLAYGGKRRVYEITDNQTKRSFLTITGLDSLDSYQKAQDAENAEAISDAILDVAETLLAE